ncbi:MAG: AAA domain-containing protein [Phycisphaerae bacterium]
MSIPPGAWSGKSGATSRRILAPLAFIPVDVTVKGGARPGIEIACREDEVDRVTPNAALLAWLEQQTGESIELSFSDEDGAQPWREIAELASRVAKLLEVSLPAALAGGGDPAASGEPPTDWSLVPCPRSDETTTKPEILSSAVIGLFPMSNQALIRDTQAMIEEGAPDGPIRSFLDVKATFEEPRLVPGAPAKRLRNFQDERLVTHADPCQARAVRLSRESPVLVVHGPPGTGKSQTITNIIGDHLAAGQRVLFVCDKRTALDVVASRLEHIGLGGLCAVIHDPQRDQKDLYLKLREQLESLGERKTHAAAHGEIDRLDVELGSIHAELTQNYGDVMQPPQPGAMSFHDLVGEWLTTPAPAQVADAIGDVHVSLNEVEQSGLAIEDVFRRSVLVKIGENPWRTAAGVSVNALLRRASSDVRAAVDRICERAASADATRCDEIPAFGVDGDITEQAKARISLADAVEQAIASVDPAMLKKFAALDAADLCARRQTWDAARDAVGQVAAKALDAELALAMPVGSADIGRLNREIAALDDYLAIAGSIRRFFTFGVNKPATAALTTFGLTLTRENATRVREFLVASRARIVVHMVAAGLKGESPTTAPPADADLQKTAKQISDTLALIDRLWSDSHLTCVRAVASDVLLGKSTSDRLVTGLRASPARAAAVVALQQTIIECSLFSPAWIKDFDARLRAGDGVCAACEALRATVDTLEDVVRINAAVAGLPDGLRPALAKLCTKNASVDEYRDTLRARALRCDIDARLAASPRLAATDAHRLQTMFDRYGKLNQQKAVAVTQFTLHRWTELQQERLMAGTLSRLNSAGAELKRRLTLRGKNAMRLRRVIDAGEKIEGGDPLFDLAPVWMASPETVAQIFPRAAQFDVIVFDESSQCRLEEALPVLTRGKRVVIAGDPKQLPPTRFFESGVVQSDAEAADTEQSLFEVQQKEVEDLLAAALSLDVQQCYLDVHYRSRNSDLIDFSNQHFYGSRLQPIPGHPANRTRYAPISLNRVDGVYKERSNELEADRVVQIVRDLLRRAEPPSIGIACFNIVQRDLITERLSEAAEADAAFSARLAASRQRRGHGSFEGLFVKNLENVQGDERDHIIISTTYGRAPDGKFRRSFGPLVTAGGGRRLNVLITRARHEVHLVTSIPRDVYHALPPIPSGQVPTGGWLLLAYLKAAEEMATNYEQTHADAARATGAADSADGEAAGPNRRVIEWRSKHPSKFALGLAERLRTQLGVGSVVHWGNDAFMIDVALSHPQRSEDVTVGVLCDWNRFDQATDPVEWEVFRAWILASQGWSLYRAWSTSLLRDEQRVTSAIRSQADAVVAAGECGVASKE